MARVHLLGDLRRRCDGLHTVEVEADTIVELVVVLEERFPDVRSARLIDMTVAIDSEVMTNADYERIDKTATVHFLMPISGGSTSTVGIGSCVAAGEEVGNNK